MKQIAIDVPEESLLAVASGHSQSLSPLAEHSRVLTPYAVEFRYPGTLDSVRKRGIIHEAFVGD